MTYQLQILHASDLEGGADAVENAPNFAAVMDALEGEFANTIKLSAGDNYIPGAFFNAQDDEAFAAVLEAAYERALNELIPLTPGYDPADYDGITFDLDPVSGALDMAIMNIIGFDASAVGNHEFDPGAEAFANIIDNQGSGATYTNVGALFPYLTANLDFSGESAFDDLFTSEIIDAVLFTGVAQDGGVIVQTPAITPATTIEKGGERIGVVGATTQLIEVISSSGDVDETTGGVEDMAALAAAIQPEIDALLAAGVNKIILVSHLQQIALEKELAGLLNGVDVIIAGGSDTLLADSTDTLRAGDEAAEDYPFETVNADGDPTLIVSTDGQYTYVGRLVVEFDDDGVVIPTSVDAAVSGAYATDEAGVLAATGAATLEEALDGTAANGSVRADIVEDLTSQLDTLAFEIMDGNIFGTHSVYLDGTRPGVRTEETNMGNLTADANLAAAREVDPTVVISFKNGGGIRDDIDDGAVGDGNISELEVANVLSFNNRLTVATMTVAGLQIILEHAVAGTDTATGATQGRFPQISGFRFSFDENATAQVLATDGDGDYIVDPATDLPTIDTMGARVKTVALIDPDTGEETVLIMNGEIVVDPSTEIKMVSLNFMVDNNGDGYPFAEVMTAPTQYISNAGVLVESFTDNSELKGEQDALAEYLQDNFSDTPFDAVEQEKVNDRRIVQLGFGEGNVENNDDFVVEKEVVLDADATQEVEGASEVIAPDGAKTYVTNGAEDRIDVFRTDTGKLIGALDLSGIADYDGVQSVAAQGGMVAAAVARSSGNGAVALFDEDGAMTLFEAGALPDMITFTPDGAKIIVANEGEPRDLGDDPLGGVTIIDIAAGTATTLDFTAFDAQKDALIAEGLMMDPRNTLSEDLEPEYIAVAPDGLTAWVSLQEANAFAILDLVAMEFTDIIPGFVSDRSLPGFEIDASNRDGAINLANYDNLYGLAQPDAIVAAEVGGATYYFTANEGDGREYEFDGDPDADAGGLYNTEARIKDLVLDPTAFPDAAALQENEVLGRLKVRTDLGDTDGDGDYDELYHYGSRSFTIYNAMGEVIWDSGSEFSRIVAEFKPALFNEDEGDFDDRSDDKGVEPEAIAVGEVDGKTYAFIGLERDNGIMIYDVSNPETPNFVRYIDSGADGHISPEVIKFIPAADSADGKARIAVSYEVSGDSVIYTVDDLTVITGGEEIPVDQADGFSGEGRAFISGAPEDFEERTFTGFDGDGFVFEGDATSRFSFDETTGVASFGGVEFAIEGNLEGGNFMTLREGGNTRVAWVEDIAPVSEGVAVDVEAINGVAFTDFLTGDGATDFRITVDSLNGGALFNNIIGVYGISADGDITDVQVMFPASHDAATGDSFVFEGLADGAQLGFFLVQDGVNAIGALEDPFFVFGEDGTADVPVLGDDANGLFEDAVVFHSHEPNSGSWNPDGLTHVLSGASEDGSSLRIGFEDLTGWGDRDFEDFVFNVTREEFVAEM